jgi:fumarate reductase subunit D
VEHDAPQRPPRHRHPAWWAFWLHRCLGPAAGAVPAAALLGAGPGAARPAALDGFLRFADQPLFKLAEWGLVVLLALHLTGGVRLLLIEFGRWSGLRKNWIAGGAGFAVAVGLAFALALIA